MNVEQIGRRDGWVCWVCENGVDPQATHGSAWAGSLDHIIPISKGGTKTDDNVRLAHRRCNSQRGNSIGESEWPAHEGMVDATPLLQALKRLEKKQGTTESVAIFSDQTDAEDASTWVVMTATMLTGRCWESDVEPMGPSHAVRLTAI